jgi:hypothetical protein
VSGPEVRPLKVREAEPKPERPCRNSADTIGRADVDGARDARATPK